MKRQLFNDKWNFSSEDGKREMISLPHDAMQRQGRSADAPCGHAGGFYLGGTYVYEKKLWVPKEWKEQEVYLEFEGVYPNAKVFLNDKEVGGCQYGYSLFRVLLEDLILDTDNQIRVEVDNSRMPDSRWYTGAGIYRPVWLLTGNKEHIEPDGIRITTLSYEPAEIEVEVKFTEKISKGSDILIEVFKEERKVAEGKGDKIKLKIPEAKLWDAETPELYRCVVSLMKNSEVLDQQEVNFGIRVLSWSNKGLKINGKTVLLKGGCIHHDNGILGARSYDLSEWRRIKRLKDSGYNAIRSSHNPLCRSALKACDTLGMYVMDETWDMWNVPKSEYDYANVFMDHYEFDLESIVAKDYNHPSVIMYSIGNEVTEPASEEGMILARKIFAKLKKLDATRPITAGINLTILLMTSMQMKADGSQGVPNLENMDSTTYNKMVSEMGNRMTVAAASDKANEVTTPILDMLDIAGYNYASSRYESEGEKHPDRIVVGAETYTYKLAENWEMVERLPYLIGDFMWTAWDYLGEAGIGTWSYDEEDLSFTKVYPWLLSGAGAFDILGNENADVGLAEVVWDQRKKPYLAVTPPNHQGIVPNKAIWRGTNARPYWSYRGCEGNDTEVEVYCKAHEVELLINGNVAGREMVQGCKAVFPVKYEPGELKAIAYMKDGNVISEHSLVSADSDPQIKVTAEENIIKSELIYVDISLVGDNQQIECNCDTKLSVQVEGGELLAFGSANPKTDDDFLSGEYTTYYGRSQAVIRAEDSEVTVIVSGQGLKTVSRRIEVQI